MRHAVLIGATLAAVGLAAPSALAQSSISVTISGTLNSSISDPVRVSGLDGALFEIDATIAADSTYLNSGGLPIVLFDPGATLTISDAVFQTLNGEYALSQSSFMPTLAAFTGDPADGFFDLVEGEHSNGTTLIAVGVFDPGPGASGAEIGGAVDVSHFINTTSGGFEITLDGTLYTSETLSVTASYIPSPGPAALAAVGGLMLSRRRR
ncbi:MAG: hypothetical protein AAGI53_06210 [Planctomycetota bacterium]